MVFRVPDWTFPFQSTLPVWGATYSLIKGICDYGISIHAPRVGSDSCPCGLASGGRISIHAPRVGSDPTFRERMAAVKEFQSTLPVWGATEIAQCRTHYGAYFNPRSPCGERRSMPQ